MAAVHVRRVAIIVALNVLAIAAYSLVAFQIGFFNHLSETLFSSPDSRTYREVANWLFGSMPEASLLLRRPFLYPLLLGVADRLAGDAGIWTLNLTFWLGTLNITAVATWRLTRRPLLAALVFVVLATNVSLIVLSFQALTELTVAVLESIWILGLVLSALPPARPLDFVLLLLPISLLAVVKPAFQPELLIALVVLAIVIVHMQRGRIKAAAAVGACCLPVVAQFAIMPGAMSNTGDIAVKDYYVSQVYASVNGLPNDLVAARVVVDRWSQDQIVAYLLNHPEPAARVLLSNLRGNLTAGSNFVNRASHPTLAAAVIDTNWIYVRLHLIFLPIVALAIWLRRDVRLVLLYVFACVLLVLPSVIVSQGDRYVLMALPLWATAYALAIADLLPVRRAAQ